MVYTNIVRRTSTRLLQQQARLASSAQQQQATAATAPIHRSISSIASSSSMSTRNEFSPPQPNSTTIRSKHSSTQIKRLFKQNPAKRRIALKQEQPVDEGVIPESTMQPLGTPPKFLSNGWSAPLTGSGDEAATATENYPFQVARTKNKPNNALGFLPVYSEHRKDGARVTTRIKKVSGDKDIFLNELRAVLQIPIPKNPRDDTIRIRTGGTIEIKGNRVQEVKTWLAGLGF
eukprot:CAMPEP_0116127458 /NCGR_PEP_ID=MMETSP0329-20121206/6850_1 /TAXON_ID=697910 /ORGANISM="Pseudo-nitzschia arenysensis, Strain B593" /LENGTH=231 /DNA_ID=CAMNT_0003621557 /DNA_START=26 /DNA_END=721 /DNA_ORIENTATION=-